MINQFTKPILRKLFWGGLRHFLSDKQYAKIRYWLELDRIPDIENPQRFTEKIQHIKLYDRTPLRQKIADRTQVRHYVAQKAEEEYLIPLIGVYDKLTAEVWQTLPNQFVLKANHGCGMLKIVFDKDEEDYEEVRKLTERWKKFDYAAFGREWAYRDVPRTIVAEELLLDSSRSIPNDYKFFCFNGRVEIIQIDFDRFSNQKRNLYDRDFNQLNTTLLYPNYKGEVSKPENLHEAITVAENLSSELNFVRVDLYLLNNRIYFGELTNYPGNGFVAFQPPAKEYEVGSLLEL